MALKQSMLDRIRIHAEEAHAEEGRLTGYLLVAFTGRDYTVACEVEAGWPRIEQLAREALAVLIPPTDDNSPAVPDVIGPVQGSA